MRQLLYHLVTKHNNQIDMEKIIQGVPGCKANSWPSLFPETAGGGDSMFKYTETDFTFSM